MATLKEKYRSEIAPALKEELGPVQCDGSTTHYQDHSEHGCW